MMQERKYTPGQIIAKCWGYSMVLYTFYEVLKVTDKSVFLQELKSKVHPDTTDGMRPLVVPSDTPVGKPIRKNITSYFGGIWDGKPCQEDHMD